MKRLIQLTITISCALLIACLSGCVTAPTGERVVDVARVARLSGVAAELGATMYLEKNPSARPYFEASLAAVAALDASGDYNPSRFADALKGLPVRELQGKEGSLYIGLAVVAWGELSVEAERANLDKAEWVRPVLKSVRLGLERALANTSTPAP